ncbi:hypothetical protein KIPB_010646, partial [Kipferlia bialata]
ASDSTFLTQTGKGGKRGTERERRRSILESTQGPRNGRRESVGERPSQPSRERERPSRERERSTESEESDTDRVGMDDMLMTPVNTDSMFSDRLSLSLPASTQPPGFLSARVPSKHTNLMSGTTNLMSARGPGERGGERQYSRQNGRRQRVVPKERVRVVDRPLVSVLEERERERPGRERERQRVKVLDVSVKAKPARRWNTASNPSAYLSASAALRQEILLGTTSLLGASVPTEREDDRERESDGDAPSFAQTTRPRSGRYGNTHFASPRTPRLQQERESQRERVRERERERTNARSPLSRSVSPSPPLPTLPMPRYAVPTPPKGKKGGERERESYGDSSDSGWGWDGETDRERERERDKGERGSARQGYSSPRMRSIVGM